MCLASSDPKGPRRCAGDTRATYGRAAAAVAELERAEAALEAGARQHRVLESQMQVEAAGYVRTWMQTRGVSEIRVDDEHETPGYALDFDDDGLAVAISWLPSQLIHNPTHPAWNPIVRAADLEDFLQRHGGEEHRYGPGEAAAHQGGEDPGDPTPGEPPRSGCTCHVVRDFAGGHFGSLASIGAECGHCIAVNEQYEFEEWWESLSPQERAAVEIKGRWFQACERVRKLGRRPGAPPPAPWPAF
jgi:hypothetical protein